MAGTAFLNKGFIKDAIRAAMEDAIDETADHVAAEARRRAPVRKVFKEGRGYRPKIRGLTEAEKTTAIRRAERFYAGNEFKRRRAVAHIKHYARASSQRRGSANALARSRGLRLLGTEQGGRFRSTSGAFRNRSGGYEPGERLSPLLTSRGKYEIRSGRAVHVEAGKVKAGGRLKASIGNTGVVETGKGVAATVEAAVSYAKFVEFPTIRTRAQPFLLPALQQEREAFKERLRNHINNALHGE